MIQKCSVCEHEDSWSIGTGTVCKIHTGNSTTYYNANDMYIRDFSVVFQHKYLCSDCTDKGFRIGVFSNDIISPEKKDTYCTCVSEITDECHIPECKNTYVRIPDHIEGADGCDYHHANVFDHFGSAYGNSALCSTCRTMWKWKAFPRTFPFGPGTGEYVLR